MAEFDRASAKAAGYSDDEIDEYLISRLDPMVSKPFQDRVEQGWAVTDSLKKLFAAPQKVIGGAVQGAKEGYGETPLGFLQGSEPTMFLEKIGVFGDPKTGRPAPLLGLPELGTRAIGGALELFGRVGIAGAYSVGGIFGAIAEEAGAPQGEANRLKRDIGTLGEVALTLGGALPGVPWSRVRRMPTGEIKEEALGRYPTRQDFVDTTNALTDGAFRPDIEAKLLELYEKHGYHPAEVWSDAATDPVLRQQLLSKDPGMPEALGLPKSAEPPAVVKPGEPPKPPGPLNPPEPEGSPFRATGETDSVRLARQAILDRMSIGEHTPKGSSASIYEMTVDKLFPLKEAETRAEAVGFEFESVADRPYLNSRLYSGWAGKAEVALKLDGPFDFHTYERVGPSLREILAPVREKLDDFRAYMGAVRSAEIHNRGLATGVDVSASRATVASASRAEEKALKQTVDYSNNIARYLRDAGVLSRNGYAAMLEANKYYIPFARIMDEEGLGVAPLGASLQARNPVHRLKGSERKIVDPIETIIRNTFVMMAMAERNVVGTKLVNMLKGADALRAELKRQPGREIVTTEPELLRLADEMREIVEVPKAEGGEVNPVVRQMFRDHGMPDPPPELVDMVTAAAAPLKADEIRVFENGVAKTYRVDEGIARAIKALDREAIGRLEKVMAPFAATLRAGAVLDPAFWGRHLFRDNFYATATFDRPGVYTPVDQVKGVGGLFFRDQDYIDWLKGGGGHVSIMALDRNYLQENLREITSKTGLMTRGWNVVRHPLTPLQAGTEIALSATHVGAFKKRLRFLEQEERAATAKDVTPWGTGVAKVSEPAPQPGVTSPVEFDAPRLGQIHRQNWLARADHGLDLYLPEGANVKETLKRTFGYDPETGIFTDITTRDTKTKQSIIDAAWAARDTSVDNARIGSKMNAFNMVSAFANAKIQDLTRGTYEAAKRSPGTYALTVLGGVVIPSATLWWLFKDDSRYQALPGWRRDLFWNVPTDWWVKATPEQAADRPADQVRINTYGQLEVNNGVVVMLPKPFFMGVLFGSGTERLLEAYYKDNPRAFKNFPSMLLDTSVGDLVPNAVVPVIEQATNQRRLGGSLIPHNVERLLPEYEYTPATTELSKKLAMVVSAFPGLHHLTKSDNRGSIEGTAAAATSPMLVENYVRQWSGNLGIYMLQATDATLRKAGVLDDPSRAATDWTAVPIIRAFVMRYPWAQTSQIQDFYDEVGSFKRLHATWTAKAQEGDAKAMERVQAIGGDMMFVKFDEAAKALQTLSRQIAKTNMDPTMPPAEKRQHIDGMYFMMHEVAKQYTQMIDDTKKALKEPQK